MKSSEIAGRDRERGGNWADRLAFEHHPHPMWLYRRSDLTLLDVNHAALAQLGYSRDEFLSLTLRELHHGDEVAGETASPHEERRRARLRRKDGSVIEADVMAPRLPQEAADSQLMIVNLLPQEALYQVMVQRMSTPVCICQVGDGAARVTAINAAAERLASSPMSEGGEEFAAMFPSLLSVVPQLGKVLEEGEGSALFDATIESESGPRQFELRLFSLAESIVGIEFRESTSLRAAERAAEERIRYQAYHDALTDLPNRMLFDDRLSVSLAHARRNRERLAVMILDLDDFKVVNDTLGHRIGDTLLQAVGDRLQCVLREEDTIARIGGDEFTLLLPEVREARDAELIARKIIDAISGPFAVGGHQLYVTTSIGISLFPEHGSDGETLLKNADNAMYRAKDSGRNTFRLFTERMKEQSSRRLLLESKLRRALERNEFELYYQPIVSGSDCSIYGVEALIRWNDPERGLIGPDDFIPIAEETRLIVPIGDWVLRTACAKAREWMARGMRGVRMAVNLSAYQLEQPDFINRVAVILNETELPPAALELEITESVAMQNAEATIRTLKRLKRMGVRVAVDDFGTGQTSLVYLTRFPVDTLKIDRAFVRDLATDAADAMVVSTVIALGKSLNLHVVGEGVETDEQLDFLRRRGCDAVQGFLFSRPVPALQIERLLEAN